MHHQVKDDIVSLCGVPTGSLFSSKSVGNPALSCKHIVPGFGINPVGARLQDAAGEPILGLFSISFQFQFNSNSISLQFHINFISISPRLQFHPIPLSLWFHNFNFISISCQSHVNLVSISFQFHFHFHYIQLVLMHHRVQDDIVSLGGVPTGSLFSSKSVGNPALSDKHIVPGFGINPVGARLQDALYLSISLSGLFVGGSATRNTHCPLCSA